MRADAIVLYATDDEADSILELALAVYKQYPDLFQGRSLPMMVTEVAPGVGVGEEPKETDGHSLTSHRVALVEAVANSAKQRLGLKEHEKVPPHLLAQAVRLFRTDLPRYCKANHVDPHNLSFNAV